MPAPLPPARSSQSTAIHLQPAHEPPARTAPLATASLPIPLRDSESQSPPRRRRAHPCPLSAQHPGGTRLEDAQPPLATTLSDGQVLLDHVLPSCDCPPCVPQCRRLSRLRRPKHHACARPPRQHRRPNRSLQIDRDLISAARTSFQTLAIGCRVGIVNNDFRHPFRLTGCTQSTSGRCADRAPRLAAPGAHNSSAHRSSMSHPIIASGNASRRANAAGSV